MQFPRAPPKLVALGKLLCRNARFGSDASWNGWKGQLKVVAYTAYTLEEGV